jgi:hypothetical protein
MFLVRVLLGQTFVNSSRDPPKFQRPPCTQFQEVLCHCPSTHHYDSVLDDAGRLFREFVVYEQCQCYPEYLITYERTDGTQHRPTAPFHIPKPANFLIPKPANFLILKPANFLILKPANFLILKPVHFLIPKPATCLTF